MIEVKNSGAPASLGSSVSDIDELIDNAVMVSSDRQRGMTQEIHMDLSTAIAAGYMQDESLDVEIVAVGRAVALVALKRYLEEDLFDGRALSFRMRPWRPMRLRGKSANPHEVISVSVKAGTFEWSASI